MSLVLIKYLFKFLEFYPMYFLIFITSDIINSSFEFCIVLYYYFIVLDVVVRCFTKFPSARLRCGEELLTVTFGFRDEI